MIDPVKAEMFTNRLAKVFKHKNKLFKSAIILPDSVSLIIVPTGTFIIKSSAFLFRN